MTYTHMTIYLLPFIFLLTRGCSRDPDAELCRRNGQPGRLQVVKLKHDQVGVQ